MSSLVHLFRVGLGHLPSHDTLAVPHFWMAKWTPSFVLVGLGIVLSTGGMCVLGGCAVLKLYKAGADYAVK